MGGETDRVEDGEGGEGGEGGDDRTSSSVLSVASHMMRAGGILVLGERLHHGPQGATPQDAQGHAAGDTPSGEDSKDSIDRGDSIDREDSEDSEDSGRLRMVNLDNGTIVGTLLQDEPVRALKVQGILLAYTRGPDIGMFIK